MTPDGLTRLVGVLVARFDEVLGPVVEDGVIRLRPISSAGDLPTGVTDEQGPGTYRVLPTGTDLRFSYGPAVDSLKAIVQPPSTPVWTMRRRDGSLIAEASEPTITTRAVIGVRACDLRALAKLDRTQIGGAHADPAYLAARRGLFLVATDCVVTASTCFCDEPGGGGASDRGHDLAITEVDSPDSPDGVRYVVRAGSDAGTAVMDELRLDPAPDDLLGRADRLLRSAMRAIERELPGDARSRVLDPHHPRWDDVAARCLTCGNCTAVCPTCFCTDMVDRIDLDGETATRSRVWDTCFSLEYSHLGPGPHRTSPMSRYRQWLSHKLGSWHEQFGESGCVGCGRCITWCPVGIDIVAEVEALAPQVATP